MRRAPLHGLRLRLLLLTGSVLTVGASAASAGCTKTGGGPSDAELRWGDAGAEIALAGRAATLPADDLAAGARPSILQDESGKRLAYATTSGEVRIVYALGDGLWLGPRTRGPLDFRAAPDLDHALGAIFENAPASRRAELTLAVGKTLGDAGLAKMLAGSVGVDAKEWDEAYAKLPEPRAADVKKELATLLERGKPTAGLERVVRLASLRDAAVLEGRVRELADPPREPRAVGVMLRALAALDAPRAAKVGCDVLAVKAEGRDALDEAALLAIASDVAAGHALTCKHVEAALGDDPCRPFFRCAGGAPLTGRETTRQDEALCTKTELAAVVTRELAKSPAAVLAGYPKAALYAFAAASAADKVPETFLAAHARRRYPIAQPKEPACESGVALGAACRCDEATLRDLACRHLESSSAHVGICKFEVDDKQKKIGNVTAALAPP